MKSITRTRERYASDAEECRQRGFKVGDRLVGDEGHGPTVIEICYIGEERILAHTISHNGVFAHGPLKREQNWTLSERDWERMVSRGE